MALNDYFFNEPQWISYGQQEFYATGLFADALFIYPSPGYEFDVTVVQIGEASETSHAGFKFVGDSGDIIPKAIGLMDSPEYLTNANTLRGGATRSVYAEARLSLPKRDSTTGGINGKNSFFEWNALTDAGFLGGTPPQWFSDKLTTQYNTMALVQDLHNYVASARLPGVDFKWGTVFQPTLIELPGMVIARLAMKKTPENASANDTMNIRWRAGNVAWGHR